MLLWSQTHARTSEDRYLHAIVVFCDLVASGSREYKVITPQFRTRIFVSLDYCKLTVALIMNLKRTRPAIQTCLTIVRKRSQDGEDEAGQGDEERDNLVHQSKPQC